jgi:PKD repeat protein
MKMMNSVTSQADLVDSLDAPSLPWTTDGDARWVVDRIVTHDGQDAVRSGAIGHSASSNLSTIVTGPANVSFWWKVASQPNHDWLSVSLVEEGVPYTWRISGTPDWKEQTIPVGAGPHTITWSYTKDESIVSGSDAGWVDQVIVNYTTTPLSLPGVSNPPTDPDSDGLYEDLNANNRLDFNDVVLMFNQMEWIAANEPVSAFDFNGNGRIDFNDIVMLFGEI